MSDFRDQYHRSTHILIDLDGTLLSSRPLWTLFFCSLLMMRRFYPVFGLQTVAALKKSLRKMLENESSQFNYDVLRNALVQENGDQSEAVDRGMRLFYEKDFPKLKFLYSPIPGAREAIERFKQDSKILVLATNPIWPLESVKRRLLWAHQNPEMFYFISSSERMHSCKPSLSYYSEILNILKVDALNVIFIGDSEAKDAPARDLKIRTFLMKEHSWSNILRELGSFAK